MSSQATKTAEDQRRTFACAVLSGVFLIAAVVLSRRITGDLSGFTSDWLACAVGLGFLTLTGGSLAFSGLLSRTQDARFRLLVIAGCQLPAVVLGLTLMPVGSSLSLAVLMSIYFVIVVGSSLTPVQELSSSALREIVSRDASAARPGSLARGLTANDSVIQHENSGAIAATPDGSSVAVSGPEPATVPSDDLDSPSDLQITSPPTEIVTHPAECPETTHWMSRAVQDGCDVVEGAFRVDFEVGQKQVAIHLPIAPALPSAPEFECEPIDGDADVRIRVTATEAWGVRLEVVRSTDIDQPQAVQIGYFASAAVSQSAAAA